MRRYSKLPQPRLPDLRGSSRLARTPPKPRYRLAQRLELGQIDQLLADYRAGATTRDLAEKYNVSKTAVTKLLTAHDVPLRHQGLSPSQVTEATRLYTTGRSVAQAALSLAVSPSSVYDALKRSGVHTRPAHQSGRRDARSSLAARAAELLPYPLALGGQVHRAAAQNLQEVLRWPHRQ